MNEKNENATTYQPPARGRDSKRSFPSHVTRRDFFALCGGGIVAGSAGAESFLRDLDRNKSTPADVGLKRGAISSQWTENWEDGMVSGNGRMGVVAFGRPEAPVFVLNESHLYTAQHDPAKIGPAKTAQFLPEIRRIIREEGYGPALDFAYRKAKENGLAPNESNDYHPGMVLRCRLAGADQVSEYRRTENFRTAEVSTNWLGAAGRFRTRTFASRANDVVVIALERPEGGVLDCDLEIEMPVGKPVQFLAKAGRNWIGTEGRYGPGNGGYNSVLQVASDGGTVKMAEGRVEVRGARSALLLARIERYRPPQKGDIDALASSLSTLPTEYERLLKPHVEIHGAIFDRVRLDLHAGADRDLTTDELLDRASLQKSLSPALMEKIYDACRYVILCSSGDLPPNLQGIWSGTWTPPWHGDYSADANLQLAIDSTCSSNMPELMEGFFRLVEAGVPSWREGARELAGCRGILYPARMQDQGTYFQQNRDWPWFAQVPIAGWLAHYFYDYYRYTGDRAFLEKRAIPYLKECALFYEDWYVVDSDGSVRATPSFSYECAYSDNATIDFAVAREVLTNLIEGCELCGVEKDGVVRWKSLLAKIPPYMINTKETTGGAPPPYWGMDGKGTQAVADGTLKEFVEANMVEFPSHRHLSSLYPLFVSYELSPEKTPRIWQAAERWYQRKISSVHETESHFRMQASLCAARLGRRDDVWSFLTAMAANGVFHSSLVPAHYDHLKVFNVDASGGIPSVIHNCLLFSLPGQLDLLPALPNALPRGTINGVLARGQVLVDELTWDIEAGRCTLRLRTQTEQTLALTLPPQTKSGKLEMDGKSQKIAKGSHGKCTAVLTLPKGMSTMNVTFSA